MTESDYWQALRKKLKNRVYTWKINASYARGVPDWYGSGVLQDLWVENKRVATQTPPPSLDLTDHSKYLSALQQKWLEDRYEEGRHVGVVVFSKSGHLFLSGLDWHRPVTRLQFLDKAMSMDELADHLVEILGEKGVK